MTKRTWILGTRSSCTRLAALLFVLALATTRSFAVLEVILADLDNVSDDLKAIAGEVSPGAMVNVIVGSGAPLSAQEQQRIATLITSLGGTISNSTFTSFSGYAASVPANRLGDLAHDTASDHIAPDRHVMPSMDVALPTIGGSSPGPSSGPVGTLLNRLVHVEDEPTSFTGKGVTVAVIDSGIDVNPDLKTNLGLDRVIVRWSATPGPGVDEFGHGTHVAGIIGGNAKSSAGPYAVRTFRGVAPDVRLISMKVLGADGSGDVSSVLKAVDWILANKAQYGIRIVNLSLGHPVMEACNKDPLCSAVESLNAAGIVVVVSAGNWGALGYGSVTSPGVAPNVITVGAAKDMNSCALDDDDISSYSSRGPTWPEHLLKPDVVAPGNRIVSLRLTGGYLDQHFPELRLPASAYTSDPLQQGDAGAYFELSGTSMAAPIVAGIVAQMLEKDPRLTPATVKARLMGSARKIGSSPYIFGAGAVDLPAALAARQTATAAPSPHVYQDPNVPGLMWIEDIGPLWGDTAIWGDTAVWGDTAIWGDTAVWGDTAIWGDTAVWGDTAIWGDTAVWGDSILVHGDRDPVKPRWLRVPTWELAVSSPTTSSSTASRVSPVPSTPILPIAPLPPTLKDAKTSPSKSDRKRQF